MAILEAAVFHLWSELHSDTGTLDPAKRKKGTLCFFVQISSSDLK